MTDKLIPTQNVELEEQITQMILKANPSLQLGDKMHGPVEVVRDGKIVKDFEDEFHVQIPNTHTIEARSVKIKTDDIYESLNFEIPLLTQKYLHPYMCLDIRLKYAVGEDVTVMDPLTFEPKIVKCTQEMYDNWNNVVYRFAFSN